MMLSLRAASVPCWVREFSDADAYMALALNNAQGELHPLEEGMHAIGSGMKQKDYAVKVGKSNAALQRRWWAAEVVQKTDIGFSDVREAWNHLAELHVAPEWLWKALVSRLVSESWTVEQARGAAQRFKETPEPPKWVDAEGLAEAIASGQFRAGALPIAPPVP